MPEQHLERERIADLNDRVQHAERQPSLIETKVERLPAVWVIFRFVAIETLEIVVEVHALVDEPHHAREHRMVQQVRIVEQCERRKPH